MIMNPFINKNKNKCLNKMKKFDELYNKIINEAKSPKFQFKKGDEVFVNIGKKTIPGKIVKASHDKELGNKYDVDINLEDGPKTFLEKDIGTEDTFKRPKNKRKGKDLLKGTQQDEPTNEEGECACGGSTPMGPGITGNSVFGSGNTACNSIVEPKEKTADDPGMTTSDIASLYVPKKGTMCIGPYRRQRKRK